MTNRRFFNGKLKRYNTRHVYKYKNQEQAVEFYESNRRKQNTPVVVLITVFAVLVGFSGSAIGETKESALKEAYMVIVDGSKSKAEAEEKLKAYVKKGYPQYLREGEKDLYPKLMLSDEIKRLNPGIWIVVVAVADDKKAAETLSNFIRSLGQGAYVRRVWVEKPDDLRLLDLRFKSVLFEDWRTGKIEEMRPIPKYIEGFKVIYSTYRKQITRGKSIINKKDCTSVVPYIHLVKHKKKLYFTPHLADRVDTDCSAYMENNTNDNYDFIHLEPSKKIEMKRQFVLVCHNTEGD